MVIEEATKDRGETQRMEGSTKLMEGSNTLLHTNFRSQSPHIEKWQFDTL